MQKNRVFFAFIVATACTPGCLFGASEASLARVMIESGYTPLTLKRAGNEFYVSCKLNGRPASLVVDTGAGRTVVGSGLLKSLGLPLTKGEENVYGMMGWAGKNIQAGEIKDFQVGPYQAGAQPVSAWDFSFIGSKPGAPTLRAGGCTEIPMRPVSHRGLTVPVRINGRSGHMVVDTGAAHTLLSQKAIAGLNMRLVSAARFWTRLGVQDVGKHVSVIHKAHFTTMEIGNFSVPPQSLAVADLPQAKGTDTDNVFFGYLGHDLLACYVGIIDCGALKLFLRFDPVIDAARRKRGG